MAFLAAPFAFSKAASALAVTSASACGFGTSPSSVPTRLLAFGLLLLFSSPYPTAFPPILPIMAAPLTIPEVNGGKPPGVSLA